MNLNGYEIPTKKFDDDEQILRGEVDTIKINYEYEVKIILQNNTCFIILSRKGKLIILSCKSKGVVATSKTT